MRGSGGLVGLGNRIPHLIGKAPRERFSADELVGVGVTLIRVTEVAGRACRPGCTGICEQNDLQACGHVLVHFPCTTARHGEQGKAAASKRSSTLESLGAFKNADVLNSLPQDSTVMGSKLWPGHGGFGKL